MNDAALLDSLHAALRNPDLAWSAEIRSKADWLIGMNASRTDETCKNPVDAVPHAAMALD